MPAKIPGLLLLAVSSFNQTKKDKFSLDKQKNEGLALAEKLNIEIVQNGILIVPGFSRDNPNVPRALDKFREQGVTAYDDLERHWDAKDFKALITYHPSRAGRSKGLFTHVVENTVRMNATVYFTNGGKVSPENFDNEFALASMVTRDDVNRLQSAVKTARPLRILRGMASSGTPPPWHIYHMNKRGHRVQANVNGTMYYLTIDRQRFQRQIDDLFDLFVNEGTAYRALEAAMAKRGHFDSDELPYAHHHFETILKGAWTYGHLATGHQSRKDAVEWGRYLLDEAYRDEAPETVNVAYNVVESAYPPDQLETLRRAVLTAHEDIRGRASRQRAYPFSGLLVCDECGYTVAVRSRPKYAVGYRCPTHWVKSLQARGIVCSNQKVIHTRLVQAFFADLLDRIYVSDDPTAAFLRIVGEAAPDPTRAIERDIADVTAEITALSNRMKDPRLDESVLPEFYAESRKLGQKRTVLEKQLARARQHSASVQSRQSALLAAQPDLVNLWDKPDAEINRILRLVMGDYRAVLRDGKIVGITLRKRR